MREGGVTMREKYIKAIREMLNELGEKEVKFIFALVQLVYIHKSE